MLSTYRASGPRSLQLLEEGRQGPLADSPLGPGWGLCLRTFAPVHSDLPSACPPGASVSPPVKEPLRGLSKFTVRGECPEHGLARMNHACPHTHLAGGTGASRAYREGAPHWGQSAGELGDDPAPAPPGQAASQLPGGHSSLRQPHTSGQAVNFLVTAAPAAARY